MLLFFHDKKLCNTKIFFMLFMEIDIKGQTEIGRIRKTYIPKTFKLATICFSHQAKLWEIHTHLSSSYLLLSDMYLAMPIKIGKRIQ